MLGIMAIVEQKGFHALVVISDSGMCKVGFCWFCVACCVPWSVWTRRTVMHFVCFTGDVAPRAVLLSFVPSGVVRPKMLRITAGTHQKDSCPRRTGNLDYLGDYFIMVSVCSALLGFLCFMLYVSLRLFSAASVSGSHLFGVRLWSTKLWIFLEGCILVHFRIQLLLVQHWIHVYVSKWRLMVIDILFMLRRLISVVLTNSEDHRGSTVAVRIWWSLSPLLGRAVSQVPPVEKTFVLPQLQLVEKLPAVVQTAETAESSAVAVLCWPSTIPLVLAEADFHGPDFSCDHRASPVSVRSRVSDVPVACRGVQVLPSRWPVGCHDRCPAYVPQLPLFNKVVDITVVAQRAVSLGPLSRP